MKTSIKLRQRGRELLRKRRGKHFPGCKVCQEEVRNEAQNAYHVPQSLAELKPRRLPPAGKTAMEMIQGQWPGEETTEELLAQLKGLG